MGLDGVLVSALVNLDLFHGVFVQVMVKLQVPVPAGRSLPSSPLPLAPHRQIYLPAASPCPTPTASGPAYYSSLSSCFEDRPVLPPRSPVPPLRPTRHAHPPSSSAAAYMANPQARCSSISLGEQEDTPPQVPPRDRTLSQPGSRSSSPLPLVAQLSSSSYSPVALPPPPHCGSPRRGSALLVSTTSSSTSATPSLPQASYSRSLLDPLAFREGRGLSSLIDSSHSSAPAPLPDRPAFLERFVCCGVPDGVVGGACLAVIQTVVRCCTWLTPSAHCAFEGSHSRSSEGCDWQIWVLSPLFFSFLIPTPHAAPTTTIPTSSSCFFSPSQLGRTSLRPPAETLHKLSQALKLS